MARSYTLGRRAEKQAETRQRIVEAAVDLHGSVGPAHTTVSMIAERAADLIRGRAPLPAATV